MVVQNALAQGIHLAHGGGDSLRCGPIPVEINTLQDLLLWLVISPILELMGSSCSVHGLVNVCLGALHLDALVDSHFSELLNCLLLAVEAAGGYVAHADWYVSHSDGSVCGCRLDPLIR